MINFKDVAHLYLGCRVHDSYENKQATIYTIALLPENENPVGIFFKDILVRHTRKFSEITPILRPLSSITKAEAAYVLEQVFCRGNNYPPSDYKLELVGDKQQNPRISISNDWFNENLTFGNNTGSIWSSDEVSRNVKIPGAIYAYLLQKRFDLFGLISSKQAIDSTTLNLNPYHEDTL